MALFSVDSIRIEWGTPAAPDDLLELPYEERMRFVNAAELPSLLISSAGVKVRVYPPADSIKDSDIEALIFALATHQIDRLPWEAVNVEERDGFTKTQVLRR